MKLASTMLAVLTTGLVPAVRGQVTIDVVTPSGLQVWANGIVRSIAAGSNVSAGYSISVVDPVPMTRASSELRVDPATPTGTTLVDLAEYGNGGVMSVVGGFGLFGIHRLRVELTSPSPTPGTLVVRYCASAHPQIGSYQGRVDIAGTGSVTATIGGCFGSAWNEQSFPVVVGASALRLDVETGGGGVATSRQGNGYGSGRWQLEFVPDPPCTAVSYGPLCMPGVTLSATGDVRHPGLLRLGLEDQRLPAAAWLLVGTQRVSVPVGLCTLLTDAVIVWPWSVDPTGHAEIFLDPMPFPGLRFTAQAAAFGPLGFRLTNGINVRCP